MSSEIEANFYQHLLDNHSMDVIVDEGIDNEILPTEELRVVYDYALEYFFTSGKTSAVTIEALKTFEVYHGTSLYDKLGENEVSIEEDPELIIQDVIAKLRGQYVQSQAFMFQRRFGEMLRDSPIDQRINTLGQNVTDLIGLMTKLISHRVRVDARQASADRMREYNLRRDYSDQALGMGFGIQELDRHIMYIHPGELATFCAVAKLGKSFLSINAALNEWRRGRVCVLFTLENSVAMTMDRLVCAATNVDTMKWQRCECNEYELRLINDFIEQMKDSGIPLHIIAPDSGQRTAEALMRTAQVLDADSVIIDQLSHMEHNSPRGKQNWEVRRDQIQALRLQATMTRLPVLLFHQISREGKKEADRRGFHQMSDIAESSEVERSSDFVLSLHQSGDANRLKTPLALLQIMQARRVDKKWWEVNWEPGINHASIRNEVPVHY